MQLIYEPPELDYIPIKSNPTCRRGLIDTVADHLWSVVLGFVLAIVMMI